MKKVKQKTRTGPRTGPWLRCPEPECGGEIAVEVSDVFINRYHVRERVSECDLDKDTPPTFRVNMPYQIPQKTYYTLRCMKCWRVFSETAKDLYLDGVWQTVTLENYRPEMFEISMEKLPGLKLQHRPKEPV